MSVELIDYAGKEGLDMLAVYVVCLKTVNKSCI